MRLVWDTTGERLYETGVDRGVLYKYVDNEFKNGVAWNGLTAVNESPSGAEASPLYADNIKYLNLMSAEEYAYTIEAYYSPEEFDECDGTVEVADGVTIGQQTRKMFGFCYRTQIGNDVDGTAHGYKLHLVYNSLASPSEKSHSTVNDSPEASTLSWSVSTTPVEVSGFKPTATIEVDSTKTPSAKLQALEAILYGSADAEPRMPLPAEVIAIIGTAGTTTGVTIIPSEATISVGDTFALGVSAVPRTAEITWTSSAEGKATVSATGIVTGIEAGSATITAKITVDETDYTDTCSITVE